MSSDLLWMLTQTVANLGRRIERLEVQDRPIGGTAAGTAAFNDAEGNPANVGTASSSDGVSTFPSRRDHVHTITMGSGSGLDADLLDNYHATAFVGTAEYTAGSVLAKLLTVDGTGTGLDADLLDGQHAAAFSGTAHTHDGLGTADYLLKSGGTADGFFYFSNSIASPLATFGTVRANSDGLTLGDLGGAPVITVPAAGGTAYVTGVFGIGTAVPANTLHVAGDARVTGLVLAQKYRALAATSLDDDVTATLTTAGRGLIYVVRASSNQHFLGFFSSGGVVEISDSASTWANSDSDGSNCLYWSSGLVLKNRTGSTQSYYYHIFGDISVV